jgi:hypothetical protein
MPAVRQLAEPDQDVLDRRDAAILGREDLRMIRFEAGLGLVRLLLTEAEEALHVRLAVGAGLPLARRAPRERGRAWRTLERLARIEQRLYIHTVVCQCHRHGCFLPKITRRFAAGAAMGGRARKARII